MSFTYIARQPIFNHKQHTVGYELLFRDGEANALPENELNHPTNKQRDVKALIGLNTNKNFHSPRCFINFSYNSIVHLLPISLPKSKIVVEILDNCIPTDELLAAIIYLNRNGYVISCDYFIFSEEWANFLPFIQIVKVDVTLIGMNKACKFVIEQKKLGAKCAFLANGLQTQEQFDKARDAGYRFFQGIFFSKAQTNKKENIAPEQLTALKLFAEICKYQINFNLVEKIIEQDVAMSFKLLSFVNTMSTRLKNPISSFKQASIYLSEERLKIFVSMTAASHMTNKKPYELYTLSMQRAKFCLQMSKYDFFQKYQNLAFMIGMSSLLDAMLDNTLELILEAIPLSDDIKTSLLQKNGPIGDLIILAEHYEQANWKGIGHQCTKLKIHVRDVYDAMEEAKTWSWEVFQAMKVITS